MTTDQSVPSFYYCSCKAGPIQMEIDCLKESIQYAIHQASEESKELEKKREDQQREIDILIAKIKESKEREDSFRRQYKDTKKGLEEVKTRRVRSDSLTSSNSLISLSSSESTGLGSSRIRPSLIKTYQLAFNLSRPSIKENYQSGALNLTSYRQRDTETRLSYVNALKLKVEARDKEIISLKGVVDDNLKMMQQLQQK